MSARYWIVDVFPVPVSPTSKAGSFLRTQDATLSNNLSRRISEKKETKKKYTEEYVQCEQIWSLRVCASRPYAPLAN